MDIKREKHRETGRQTDDVLKTVEETEVKYAHSYTNLK